MNADYIILILLVLLVILLIITDWIIKSVYEYFKTVQRSYEFIKEQLEKVEKIHELENKNYKLISEQYEDVQKAYEYFLTKELEKRT